MVKETICASDWLIIGSLSACVALWGISIGRDPIINRIATILFFTTFILTLGRTYYRKHKR